MKMYKILCITCFSSECSNFFLFLCCALKLIKTAKANIYTYIYILPIFHICEASRRIIFGFMLLHQYFVVCDCVDLGVIDTIDTYERE